MESKSGQQYIMQRSTNANDTEPKNQRTVYGNILIIVFAIIIFFALYIIMGAIIQGSWNMSISEIFETKKITLYQAIALFVLSSVLFGQGVSVKTDLLK